MFIHNDFGTNDGYVNFNFPCSTKALLYLSIKGI